MRVCCALCASGTTRAPSPHPTCMASSRVGEITMAPVPLRGMNLARYISSTQGMRKASVLPDPAVGVTNRQPSQNQMTQGAHRPWLQPTD